MATTAESATEFRMPIDWPARTPLDPASLAGPGDGELINRHPWVDRTQNPWVATVREEPVRVLWSRAAGVGVVRSIEGTGPDRSGTGTTAPPEETGERPEGADPESMLRLVFVSSWTRETADSLAAFVEPAGRADWAAAAADFDHGDHGDPVDRHWGVRMRYRPADAGVEPRGVLVHLHGLGGHDLERSVQGPLRKQGWGILECIYPLANWSRLSADVADPASVDALGADLATIIDNRFAELAFAAEAGLEALAAAGDPAAAAGPVLIASFSAGGNAAPAVTARLGDRVRGLAIVVAGADLMRISVTSGLGDTGFDARRHGRTVDRRRLTDDELAALSAAYLERVRLDGAKVAPRLRELPVLMMLGRFDAVVPVATGRALRAGLGGPETWWVLGGHVGGYVSLLWNGPRIGRWLGRQGAADEPAAAGS
jgi:hypothetical protein